MISNIGIKSNPQSIDEYFVMINLKELNDFELPLIIQDIIVIVEMNLILPQKMLFSYI